MGKTFLVRQFGDFLEKSPLWKDKAMVHYDFGILTIEAETGEEAYDKAVSELEKQITKVMNDPYNEITKELKKHGPTVDDEYWPTQGVWCDADDPVAVEEIKNMPKNQGVKTVFVPIRLPGWE